MCFGQPPPSPPFFCPSPLTNALSAYPLSFLRGRTKTGTVQHLLPPSPKRASPTPAGLCGRHWSHTFAISQHAFQKKKKLSGSSQSRLICASVCSLRFCVFQLSQVRRPKRGALTEMDTGMMVPETRGAQTDPCLFNQAYP